MHHGAWVNQLYWHFRLLFLMQLSHLVKLMGVVRLKILHGFILRVGELVVKLNIFWNVLDRMCEGPSSTTSLMGGGGGNSSLLM